ncbi:MAG: biopolymer transporter ExbD [candidate division WOR-3 bacterium]|nr:biopolymer transporter ExbD [candidate division WOR-3 bacterium]MCX7948155.1 biopolymer transporter ExbD [candidate division WOR-3 bacterium]MDW8151036.1 biopolymer transporter ExbD [candidate division WOR-3 bacterium]
MAVRIRVIRKSVLAIPLISLANLALIMVIFMVFLVRFEKTVKTKSVVLPNSVSSYKIVGQKNISTIYIYSNHEIYAKGFRINSIDDIKNIYSKNSKGDITILIRADKNVSVNTIIDIIDKLRSIGITKVALVTGG